METEAGDGQAHVYRIHPETTDQEPLKAEKHYIGIEALSWFVNRESSWLKKRSGTGTVKITVNGDEEYNAALGTFELDDGAKVAPIFNKRILKERSYWGDDVSFVVNLSMLKRDSAIGGILKSAASSSLDIVSGMVETATAIGPAKILASAGASLITGVNELLNDDGVKADSFFTIEDALTADRIKGKETYLLFHRGANLEESLIKIDNTAEMAFPSYNGNRLTDGAWILFRIKRSDEYPDIRPWFETRKKLKGRVIDHISNFEDGIIDKESALEQFLPSDTGDETIVDEYFKLRTAIRNDGVLTVKQESLFISELRKFVFSARKAIDNDDLGLFEGNKNSILKLVLGEGRDKEAERILLDTAKEAIDFRLAILPRESKKLGIKTPKLNINDFMSSSELMPNSIRELNS